MVVCHSLSVSSLREKSDEIEENHNDVCIENNSPQDVVINFNLIALSSHDQLSINNEIDTENNNTDSAVDNSQFIKEENEHENHAHCQGH